uniref:NADH-ubiquinone oxidoreductase chain 3 n=1 Tax=Podura aquatica TaxID=50589 RepID=Q6DVG1_9HEXA|nr:NADH dehydrogenase subunit 3 [Podura aquatica]AAT69338.1 NADH dehydrogenase subunit 3 [Podura aquatica]
MIMLLIMVGLGLPLALILVNTIMFKKSYISKEKLSAFECGFDPKNQARLPFSMRFYLIAIIFLIFDIELALIMPFPLVHSLQEQEFINFTFTFFTFILLAGVLHEWTQGALNWSI